jgi:polyisoprenyl-teichoic acid--peptidoglycan teichoic acid transferase
MGRSDAIVVVRLDPERQYAAFLSLPRDLWVPIPGAGEGKINSAYFIGETQGNGPALARDTISSILGIAIDYTVVADFAGFRSVIDMLGGVPVEIPREIYDAQFPTEDYGYTVAHFQAGMEVMNGERALTFSRIRHPDSDFERMRRQQLVLLGIGQKLGERGVLTNLHEADAITAALRPYVRTDMPPELTLGLMWSMRSLDPSTIKRLVLDGSMASEGMLGGAYVLLADQSVLNSLGAQLLTAP